MLLRLAGQVVGPGLHQFPTAFKVICSPVGQFRSRTFDVAQGKLGYLPWRIRTFSPPISEAGSHTVGYTTDAIFPHEPANGAIRQRFSTLRRNTRPSPPVDSRACSSRSIA